MNEASFARLLRGKFSFFEPDPDELRRIMPDWAEVLPVPQRIFLAREEATPIQGFPVLITPPLRRLRDALAEYVVAEEALEVAIARGHGSGRAASNKAWEGYAQLLELVSENATSASFGRRFPSILWLYHSIGVARLFKESPRRVLRRDLEVGRAQGDAIRYRVFNRFLDRVLSLAHDVAGRIARLSDEEEKEHFPYLLTRMRDNVLILTEDHISPDLGELKGYFAACLRIDPREFRRRLAALAAWHEGELERPGFRRALAELLGMEEIGDRRRLLTRPGYIGFLSHRADYDEAELLPRDWVKVWDRLLVRLKEYELLAAMRRFVVPVREREGRLECPSPGAGLAGGRSLIHLSSTTRPLDFTTSWVVDPVVERFGLIYDITEFSAIVSSLRRTGSQTRDDSIRQIFRFQRRVNRMTRDHRLELEKYLGDGALYSGRFPTRLIAAAVHLQRYYQRALEAGFPFDRGLRVALNYGRYRLLPIEGAGEDQRYEFFGHGIVELTRLVTGKTLQEIDDIKTVLLSRGYAVEEVERFFAPVARQSVQLSDKLEEARPFYAYVNPNGVLVNEGIVATHRFIESLATADEPHTLFRVKDGRRRYLAFRFDEGSGPLTVGIRKLGLAQLKGLGPLPVYELIDGETWGELDGEPVPAEALLESLERDHQQATATTGGR